MVIRRPALAVRPALPQGMPADQGAPEREEGLVNVGSLLVPHAQAAKLIQPSERALHDPPPLAQATPMHRAARGEHRENVASSQALPYGLRVQSCELRDDSIAGAGGDVMQLENGEPLFSRRCGNEQIARYVAAAAKTDLLRAGWSENSRRPIPAQTQSRPLVDLRELRDRIGRDPVVVVERQAVRTPRPPTGIVG